MRVSLKWLSDYVDLRLSSEELAHRLTMAGLAVDTIERTGADWGADIRVGSVDAVDPHPNADRLRLATVDVGPGERHRVVCGAPNLAVGQKIAFATVGARVFDGHTGKPSVLKPAVIRGVESAGMVLSERELGLSEDHEGILVLPDDAPLGRPLADLLGAEYADRATLLLSAYPFALFYNVPYTESLFLLGAVGACSCFLRRRWIASSAPLERARRSIGMTRSGPRERRWTSVPGARSLMSSACSRACMTRCRSLTALTAQPTTKRA